MLKKLLAISLTLSKVSLLVLLSSMSIWGNSAMAMKMPCEKIMQSNNSQCKVCTLAAKTLSEPFVQRVEKKEKKNFAPNPLSPPCQGEIFRDFELKENEKYVFPPPKLLSKNSYLFAKKKIVLVI